MIIIIIDSIYIADSAVLGRSAQIVLLIFVNTEFVLFTIQMNTV